MAFLTKVKRVYVMCIYLFISGIRLFETKHKLATRVL